MRAQAVEIDKDIVPFEYGAATGATVEVEAATDQFVAQTQDEFIAETLAWCAELFGASRVRFVRPLAPGGWVVYTRQKEVVSTHQADYAEIAMAYTVGLGRQPLVVTRPRIAHADPSPRSGQVSSGLRPIALSSYLGIPVLCQDRLVGVVEFAGEVRPDLEAALYAAQPRLANVGERLLFDPRLTRRRTITPESTCLLDGAVWHVGAVTITPQEFAFLGSIDGPTTVAEAGAAAGLDAERAVELAESLAERGLIAVRP